MEELLVIKNTNEYEEFVIEEVMSERWESIVNSKPQKHIVWL